MLSHALRALILAFLAATSARPPHERTRGDVSVDYGGVGAAIARQSTSAPSKSRTRSGERWRGRCNASRVRFRSEARECTYRGADVPCTSDLGVWSSERQCFVQRVSPQPEPRPRDLGGPRGRHDLPVLATRRCLQRGNWRHLLVLGPERRVLRLPCACRPGHRRRAGRREHGPAVPRDRNDSPARRRSPAGGHGRLAMDRQRGPARLRADHADGNGRSGFRHCHGQGHEGALGPGRWNATHLQERRNTLVGRSGHRGVAHVWPSLPVTLVSRGGRIIHGPATAHWLVTWTGAGQSGQITFTMTGQREQPVTEVQVLQTQ